MAQWSRLSQLGPPTCPPGQHAEIVSGDVSAGALPLYHCVPDAVARNGGGRPAEIWMTITAPASSGPSPSAAPAADLTIPATDLTLSTPLGAALPAATVAGTPPSARWLVWLAVYGVVGYGLVMLIGSQRQRPRRRIAR